MNTLPRGYTSRGGVFVKTVTFVDGRKPGSRDRDTKTIVRDRTGRLLRVERPRRLP